MGSAPEAAAEAGDAHAGHEMPSRDRGDRERHDLPAHCPAAMACSVVALASGEIGIGGRAVSVEATVVAHDDARPRSETQAPEPPPPRA